MRLIKNIFSAMRLNIKNLPGGRKSVSGGSKKDNILSQVEEAKKDWQAAMSFFNNVCEKELVDQAIYYLNAAECRYFFLLKKSRLLKSSKK